MQMDKTEKQFEKEIQELRQKVDEESNKVEVQPVYVALEKEYDKLGRKQDSLESSLDGFEALAEAVFLKKGEHYVFYNRNGTTIKPSVLKTLENHGIKLTKLKNTDITAFVRDLIVKETTLLEKKNSAQIKAWKAELRSVEKAMEVNSQARRELRSQNNFIGIYQQLIGAKEQELRDYVHNKYDIKENAKVVARRKNDALAMLRKKTALIGKELL